MLLLGAAGCDGCSRKGSADANASTGDVEPLALAPTPLTTPPGRAAYVTNNGSDTISVLDRDGDRVETVKLDLDPDAHEAPHHLAIDAVSSSVFVALAFPPEPSNTKKKKDPHASHGNAADLGKLVRLDLAKGLAGRAARLVDENPGDVVLTEDKKRVLVTHFDMKRAMDVAARGGASPATMFASLVVLEAATMKQIGKRPICVAPHGVVTTRDGLTAFIACYGSDELAVVDLGAPTLPVARHPLGAAPGVPGVPRYGPYSATLTPDESKVVLADLEGQDLRIFDRKEKRFETATIPLAAKAFMPAFTDAHTLLVPLQAPDGLARVDLAAGRVKDRISFAKDRCTLPHVVRVAKDGRVYLVCEGDHQAPGSVVELDRDTLAEKRRWTVGVYPDGIAFGDD